MEYELEIERLTVGTVCSLQLLLVHTSVMGPQGLGLSGLSGRLDDDGGGDWGVGDGDLAKAAGPKPEKREQNNNLRATHTNNEVSDLSRLELTIVGLLSAVVGDTRFIHGR